VAIGKTSAAARRGARERLGATAETPRGVGPRMDRWPTTRSVGRRPVRRRALDQTIPGGITGASITVDGGVTAW